MTTLTMENPVFVTYMISAAIMILKIMGQGWMTVYRMLKINAGLASPEDVQVGMINKDPRPEQLEVNDYVDRSRRMHRNDLENIPAFLACGLLFVITGPSYLLANILMYGFVGTVRRHINWNTQRPDLKEDLAHLVQDIKQRICGIASAGFPSFSV